MKAAFLVSHTHALPRGEDDDVKIIGVYSSEASAKLAVRRAKKRPGFCDHPKGFAVDRYEFDKDEWREGFVTIVYRGGSKRRAGV